MKPCADCGATRALVMVGTSDGRAFCGPCWRDSLPGKPRLPKEPAKRAKPRPRGDMGHP